MPKQDRKLNFKRRSFEANKKRSEQWGNLRDSYLTDHVSMWKPSDGENCIRILPATWDDAEHFGLDIFVHYNVGPDSSAFLDLKRMKGEPDPITEACEAATAEGDDEYAKELRSVKRVLVYLIDRDKPKEGVQMWAMPWTVDKDIATQSTDSRTRELLYVDDPDDGYDLYISREGTGARTKYTVKIARNPSAVELDDVAMDILENHPLTECLTFHTYEHIAQVFSGKKPVKSNEEAPPKTAAKPASKKAVEETPTVEVPTYGELMLFDEDALFDLIESLDLDVDASIAESVEELQELVAKALGLEKPKPAAARRTFAKKEPEPKVEEEEETQEEEPASKAGLSSRLASLRNRNK
jgi:hypothetical protein